jgi:hypothetical protein
MSRGAKTKGDGDLFFDFEMCNAILRKITPLPLPKSALIHQVIIVELLLAESILSIRTMTSAHAAIAPPAPPAESL